MRNWVVGFIVILLSACGASQQDAALEACFESARHALQRDAGSSFEIDAKRSADSVKTNDDDTIELRVVSFLRRDEGEPQQRDFACKVRFAEGKPTPDVISFTFLWQAEGG